MFTPLILQCTKQVLDYSAEPYLHQEHFIKQKVSTTSVVLTTKAKFGDTFRLGLHINYGRCAAKDSGHG